MSENFGYKTTHDLTGDINEKPKKVDKVAIAFQPDSVEVELRELPFSARFALYTVLLLIISAIIWAWVSQVDRTVTTRGKLISQARTVVKQPYRSSVIRTINVRAGDVVSRGDIIVSLDPTLTKADQGQILSRIKRLEVELERLNAENNNSGFNLDNTQLSDPVYLLQKRLFLQRRDEHKATLESYSSRIEALNAQRNVAIAQTEQTDAQLELSEQKLLMIRQLSENNVTSKIKRKEAETETKHLNAVRLEKITEQERYAQQVLGIKAERNQYLLSHARKITERKISLSNELSQLKFELEKAQRFSDFDVFKAETDGIILDVTKKSVGSVVQAAEILFTIVPIDEGLDIELEIPAQDIGWVHVGQPVRIKLDPFPFQRHGTLEGKLISISPDAFQRNQNGQTFVYYQARVDLIKDKLRNLPVDFKMLPGITATAEIKVGERTVLSYVTDTFHKALDESLKEPN